MSSTESSYRNQPRRRFSSELKREVVELLLEQAATVAEVARAHDLHPNQLCRWRTEYFRGVFGAVREFDESGPTLLPVEVAEVLPSISVAPNASDAVKSFDTVGARQIRRLKVVLPKGQIHVEDVDTDTRGMLIEALR